MYLDQKQFLWMGNASSLQIVLNRKKAFINLIKNFIKNYDEDSDKGYTLEVDVEYPKNLLNLYGDLPFLAERKKIKKMQQACLQYK